MVRRLSRFLFLALCAYAALSSFPQLRDDVPSQADIQHAREVLKDPQRWHELKGPARSAVLMGVHGVIDASRDEIKDALVSPRQTLRNETVNALGQLWIVAALLVGLLVFAQVFLVGRKSPHRRRAVGYTFLAAPLFLLASAVLIVPLFAVLLLNGALAETLDPQRAVVEGVHAVMRGSTERMLFHDPAPLAPMAMGGTVDDPMAIGRLKENLPALADALKPTLQLMRAWVAIGRWVPVLLVFATALLFIVGVRRIFVDVALLPSRAARGDPTPLRDTLRAARSTLREELRTTALVCMILVFLTLASGIAVHALGYGGALCMLEQVKRAGAHLSHNAHVDYTNVTMALGVVPVALLLGLAVIALSGVAVILRARRRLLESSERGSRRALRAVGPMLCVQWMVPVALVTVGRGVEIFQGSAQVSQPSLMSIPLQIGIALTAVALMAHAKEAVRKLLGLRTSTKAQVDPSVDAVDVDVLAREASE